MNTVVADQQATGIGPEGHRRRSGALPPGARARATSRACRRAAGGATTLLTAKARVVAVFEVIAAAADHLLLVCEPVPDRRDRLVETFETHAIVDDVELASRESGRDAPGVVDLRPRCGPLGRFSSRPPRRSSRRGGGGAGASRRACRASAWTSTKACFLSRPRLPTPHRLRSRAATSARSRWPGSSRAGRGAERRPCAAWPSTARDRCALGSGVASAERPQAGRVTSAGRVAGLRQHRAGLRPPLGVGARRRGRGRGAASGATGLLASCPLAGRPQAVDRPGPGRARISRPSMPCARLSGRTMGRTTAAARRRCAARRRSASSRSGSSAARAGQEERRTSP